MTAAMTHRSPGFWQLQCGGWLLLYLLCLAGSAPHLHESYIFAYNTWVVVILFAVTLALRPALRSFGSRSHTSWFTLHSSIFGLCFFIGSAATYAISLVTFGYRGFRLSYWSLSGVQCSIILFLWAVLYLGVRQWNDSHTLLGRLQSSSRPEIEADKALKQPATYPPTFAVKSGNRVEIVSVEHVLWIASSKDYVELHTARSTHLLRETMTSLTQRLDPREFMRVHRSRIIRLDQIRELVPLENGEYRIKLKDGTEHRSSRTYAGVVSDWMRRSTGQALPAD